MSAQLQPYDDRVDWLKWRRQGVGASDVAGILGLPTAWSSPWSVWAEKLQLVPDQEQSALMEFGQRAEPMVAPWFHDLTGMCVRNMQAPVMKSDNPIARCTIDGFVYPRPKMRKPCGLLEIKTASYGKTWDSIPEHYETQAQWQMYVTGLDVVYFAVLAQPLLHIYTLERDQDDIDFMVEEVDKFWNNHVLTQVAPPTDGHKATLAALGGVWPQQIDGATVSLDEIKDRYQTWQQAKQTIKDFEQIKNSAVAEMKSVVADAEIGTINGEAVVSWKTTKKGVRVFRDLKKEDS